MYNQLKEPLSGNVELSRNVANKNLSMIVNIEGTQAAQILFPSDFPESSLDVVVGSRKTKLDFPYNTNMSLAEFANKVVKKLLGLILN